MNKPTFSVVIPVYNSDRSLIELARRLVDVFNNELRDTFEIIFVDDCSISPTTWSTLKELSNNNKLIRSFRLSKNFGQGTALMCGMSVSNGEWIVTMDDDLQHSPEDIPFLVAQKEHDVVIGRFPNKKCSMLKKIASNIKNKLDVKLLGLPQGLVSTPFKLIKKKVVMEMLVIRTTRPFIIGLILMVTNDIINVYVNHVARSFGQSNYTLRKSFSLLSNLLFNNSSFLLRVMSIVGFWIAGSSFLLGFYLILRKLLYQHIVQGWTSLMVALLFSTGITVFCLGIVGEYVWRLLEITEKRPLFSISERVDRITQPD